VRGELWLISGWLEGSSSRQQSGQPSKPNKRCFSTPPLPVVLSVRVSSVLVLPLYLFLPMDGMVQRYVSNGANAVTGSENGPLAAVSVCMFCAGEVCVLLIGLRQCSVACHSLP